MSHDITAIKDRLSLLDLFKRDGYDPRRMGSGWFVCCPFHDEKTASCKVEEKKFHCFGCGAGSDVFDYWERSRGISKRDAIDQLASLAGVSPDISGYTRPLQKTAPRPQPEEVIPPLTAEERGEWAASIDHLRSRPREITRIASWRGIDEAVIHWALDRGIIGLKKWFGQWREAFLVEMPLAPDGPFIPVSTHIRLAPLSRGNPHERKASWHFDPKNRGAWPLVFGQPHSATHIFMVEGQWDALALIHLMRWHTRWPDGTALIAMRGATSFRKLLSHYTLHEKSTVFAIADADNAGAGWFAADGFIHQISLRVARVHSFWPGERGADLNDLVKSGFTRDSMRALLAPKLYSRHHRKPFGSTFYAWCRKHTSAPDPVGTAARLVCADPARPAGRARPAVWQRHWRRLDLAPELIAALTTAWETYKSECTPI